MKAPMATVLVPSLVAPVADLLPLVLETARELCDGGPEQHVTADQPLLEAGLDSLSVPTFVARYQMHACVLAMVCFAFIVG